MSNSYLKQVAARGGSGHGRESERRIAKKLGAQLTPASGAVAGAKGDMKLPEFLLEAKSTKNATMSLEHGWLVKISTEALNVQKTPALSVSFVTPEGKATPHGDWVLIPMHLFKELTQ